MRKMWYCILVLICVLKGGGTVRKKRRIMSGLLALCIALSVLPLSACTAPKLTLDPEELYALPELPERYTALNKQLSAIQESGAEYAAPVSGSNIQPVQMMDLDGDGREEALAFFENHQKIRRKLQTLYEVGLSYVKLGQPSTTLSGGEAQRVKLANELARRGTGKTVYILDEPTTGLHIADVHRLIEVLQKLVDAGNTVIVIEHNLDLIKCADHIIDLGPEGGSAGGLIIAEGTPEQVAEVPGSFTGQYLKPLLESGQLRMTIPDKPNSRNQKYVAVKSED